MKERGLHTLRPNSWIPKALPSLTAALFIAMVLVWSIDSHTIQNIRNIVAWRNHQQAYIGQQEITTIPLLTLSLPSSNNLTHRPNSTTLPPPENLTPNYTTTKSNQISLTSWILLKLHPNFTSNFFAHWRSPHSKPCQYSRSENIKIPAIDYQNSIELSTGEVHEFIFSAYDGAGNPRCSGGDYFETDISGERWKSRPPVNDLGNGSYSMLLQVHPDFAGEYNLTIFLLFRSYDGLRFSPERFAFRRELRKIPIKFFNSISTLPDIHTCRRSDFNQDIWSGRWTRHGKNDTCEISQDGRYRCFSADYPCQSPWCEGSLGLLESNGWVYSAHCAFRIFPMDLAWKCLQNRWIFFWGDSNHVDTIRNLLNFILGRPDIKSVPRRFDMNFTNPTDPKQAVRITSIFNGHWNASLNYEGLNSLQNEEYQNLLKQYFSEKTVPDSMIMNSGLHDGIHWKSVRRFAIAAEYAANFWEEVLGAIGKNQTKLLYRNTVATGGYARDLAYNPNKMEAFNLILLDNLRKRGLVSGVIDNFDMTFPWHYDNRCNDGVHYGRMPQNAKWRDGVIGHQYFVDLMLGHVLLNSLCSE